ncbi:MAG: hypothetical protein QME51_04040 [Planctomycetota bacterium]|nr:hypothetical protein [Planctomycetota bacterium]MDI6787520.1 hypothetical protein [Planctomycetota bacterium]
MGHAYTPGLRVTERTLIRKKRILPIQGNILVNLGDKVNSDTIIARTELPGKVHTVNVVNLLSIAPEDINHYMLKKVGDKIEKNEAIAESKPIIKWFKTVIKSSIKGSVENVSEITGQVLLREEPQPLELKAYIDSEVVQVIEKEGAIVETYCSFIQGIFGIGGEINAIIQVVVKSPEQELTVDLILPEHKDKIIVGGSYVSSIALKKAIELGVKGIVVGGFDDKDLKSLLGYDLGVAITGTEKIGLTLILTEGFGRINMAQKTFELFCSKQGKKASISGATQIRAGVIRPEIIISDPSLRSQRDSGAEEGWERGALKEGDQIRIIREPYFGKLARVKALPNELTKIETESPVRVLSAEFPDGKIAIIPRANVELLEE